MPAERQDEPIEEMDRVIYRSFLLRCWQEAGAGRCGQPAWRFALVQLGSRQSRRGFASLDDLVDYLRAELAE